VLSCLVTAAAIGAFEKPPSSDSSNVNVVPTDPEQLDGARVPEFAAPPLAGVTFVADTKTGHGAANIKATRATEQRALVPTHAAAIDYVRWLTARQDRWLRHALRQGGDHRLRAARRSLLDNRARYELFYKEPATGAGAASAPLRGALIGLLIAGLAGALSLAVRRRQTASTSGDGGGPAVALAAPPTAALIAAAAAASGVLVALLAARSPGVYTFCFIALLFGFAFVYALEGGPAAIRNVLIAVIAVAPLRGALLALADAIDLPNSYLTFNAIQPSLIAACAAAVLLAHRSLLRDQPPLLTTAWAAIAAVSVLDFATQTVGLKLYAIGLAQYLAYPTFAVLAWPLLRPRDRERVVWALVALGALVAASIFLEVAGLYFTEAVRDHRYGGATGSYLHAALFLGATAVLALGVLFSRWSPTNALVAIAAIGVVIGGLGLTYTRGGFAIATIGALVMLVVLTGRNRLRLVVVTIAATALGLGLSSVLGGNIGHLAHRTSSGTSVKGDVSNEKRLTRMKKAINDFRALPVAEKAFGKGLAATGNASRLTSQTPDATESYPLKLLVETGVVGFILIGAIMVWAVLRFARTAWSAADPLLKAAGAAGIGLAAESIIYPTLEVQLISLTWWLLVVLCLKAPGVPAPRGWEVIRSRLASRGSLAEERQERVQRHP
jgi:O-antigen ligase/polysaccharide polymerase Wzy-like membrane protein